MHYVRLVQRFSIDVHILIDELQMIPWQTDDALHEVLVVLKGILENNDVATLERAVRQQFFVPRTTATENEFIDQEMVADQKGSLHGSGGNLESLNNEAGAEESENHGDEQGLEILRKGGLVASLRLDGLLYDRLLNGRLLGHVDQSLTTACANKRSSARRAACCSASFLVLPVPFARQAPFIHTST